MFGKLHSKETREKICKSKLGKPNPEGIARMAKINSKPVICHQNGIVFESAAKAAKYFGISQQAVTQVVKRQRKQCKGLTFSYS